MDGDVHRHRKMMFMSLLTVEKIGGLTQLASDIWNRRLLQWTSLDRIVVYRQAQEILTEDVCQWAGIQLEPSDVSRRTSELVALFDYAANIGPKHWWARLARKRNEAWLCGIVEQIRHRIHRPPVDSAAFLVANHRDQEGKWRDSKITAAQVSNILRQPLAGSDYVVLCIHADRTFDALCNQ